jgi:large subunit ribosomal protein L3
MTKIVAKKIEMTQVFNEDGIVTPVTRLKVLEGIDQLQKGVIVNVIGISKGKGFQGVVKRHSFAGGPKTHGQSDRHRAPGSIGERTDPGKVWKGQRMAGRMGGVQTTVKRLVVIDLTENSEILLKGAVPGGRNNKLSLVVVN